ncbi:uncharacterized protein EDB91DRAFT_519340 [Suillus paluster]|uniref:uncharacterized protein n=1 Tax=Suillus paluster TaxID=48578 RepID=UPI001B87AD7A|nr:uncharacterized protein EDB91DRAFT_519340 [Suillus paluster]KAG1752482.1 hypothetical protein EDB91DRAFT_519340 [Suillus paluster]
MIEPIAAHGELDTMALSKYMAVDQLTTAPTFISSRSADVILSDIRPTKLTPDALSSINALLDELLYSILNAARALSPSRLRTAMHKVLPTTLGKEAILEAEMELRAYYQRTVTAAGSGSSSEDGVFDLQWAFELLRLKCEAYSTLSDTDENSDAENRLKEHMHADGVPPPKQEVLAPASLYLTAIIESICEHILSNVGRVASRDSSRATANSQDLFIALCEDSTIYGFFKNMKVYGQIETLSKLPKPRRSKSFTREKMSGTTSPVSSREGDAFRRDSSRPRISSESSNTGPAMVVGSNHHSARSSIDKARSIKIFSGNSNRGSNDHPNGPDSVTGHRKTDSLVSANAKQSIHSGDRSPISPTFSEDRSQEFDDMMRSGSTMKVSLTPDRLRTMEALNKEKARFNGRKSSLQSSHKDSISSEVLLAPTALDQPKRATRPSLRHVDSIHEDDEVQPITKPPPTSRPRQLSAATASGFSPPSSARARSASSADPMVLKPTALSPPRVPRSDLGSSLKLPNLTPSNVHQKRTKPIPHGLDMDQPRVHRTRTVARNRESLDLDDVMGGSDDEEEPEPEKPESPPCYNPHRGLSASARELIEFLAEGPPEPPATSPPANSGSLLTPKKTGRLQRMISKITLNGTEKVRSDNESGKSSPWRADAPAPLLPNKSLTNISSLANRPVPPRYPIDLPSATSSESRSSADNVLSDHRARKQSLQRKPVPPIDPKACFSDSPVATLAPGMGIADIGSPVPPVSVNFAVPITSKRVFEHDTDNKRGSGETASSGVVRVETPALSTSESKVPSVQIPERSSSKVVLSHLAKRTQSRPTTSSPSIPPSVIDHAHDMRQTLVHATSAAECRLLIDIFLTRAGLVADSSELQALVSAPLTPASAAKESHMENAIVELLLGGDEEISDPPAQAAP